MSLVWRLLGKIAFWALLVVLLIAAAAASFRLAAAARETQTPEQAAGAGATFTTVASLKLHYRSWGPETGQPLILVHGTMAWADTFRDIAEPLAAMGYHVLAPDLPPFGFSERPAVQDYSRAAQAKRILGFATVMGFDRFVLGVHSYGGGAAVEAALMAPERIEGLVLLDVALGVGKQRDGPPFAWLLDFDGPRNLAVSSTFTNPLSIGYGLRDFIADDSVVTPERIALYEKPLVLTGTTDAIGRWLFTGLYKNESKSASLDPAKHRAFTPPVLAIWGRDDDVTPLVQGEDIVAGLPNAKLEVLDGVNHIPHVERPAEVVRLIDGFMRALPGAGAGPDPAADKGDRVQ